MPGVRVVTDSSAGLPPQVAAAHGITVVPLGLALGDRAGTEGVDISAADVLAALTARQRVSTSGPAPADLAAAYRGDGEVVSIHLSSGLSSTYAVARGVAGERVRVLDSGSVGMGLGFIVLAAAEAAAAGADVEHVLTAAQLAADRTTVLFSVTSLEYLRRGGRIGTATALLGAALAVQPLLQLEHGAVALRERVRTAGKAAARLAELAAAAAGAGPARVAVMHLGAEERAVGLQEVLAERLPQVDVLLGEVGPSVGAHTGPGVLGVAVTAD